jgi:hypothetical protein
VQLPWTPPVVPSGGGSTPTPALPGPGSPPGPAAPSPTPGPGGSSTSHTGGTPAPGGGGGGARAANRRVPDQVPAAGPAPGSGRAVRRAGCTTLVVLSFRGGGLVVTGQAVKPGHRITRRTRVAVTLAPSPRAAAHGRSATS